MWCVPVCVGGTYVRVYCVVSIVCVLFLLYVTWGICTYVVVWLSLQKQLVLYVFVYVCMCIHTYVSFGKYINSSVQSYYVQLRMYPKVLCTYIHVYVHMPL